MSFILTEILCFLEEAPTPSSRPGRSAHDFAFGVMGLVAHCLWFSNINTLTSLEPFCVFFFFLLLQMLPFCALGWVGNHCLFSSSTQALSWLSSHALVGIFIHKHN